LTVPKIPANFSYITFLYRVIVIGPDSTNDGNRSLFATMEDSDLSIVCRRAPFDHGLLPTPNAGDLTVAVSHLGMHDFA
jgi:hypothetical protein